jgi:EAL domain-containing protein (putative c-di-GMP-specific phosphodiesterase class I)
MPRPPDVTPTEQALQLLGFAFAGADLLFELSAEGEITFTLGASESLLGRSSVQTTGLKWPELVAAADHDLVSTILGELQPGDRVGPVRVALRPPEGDALLRQAWLAVFRLPQRPAAVSCALSLAGVSMLDLPEADHDGLLDREGLAAAAELLIREASQAGLAAHLDLVELQGLGPTIGTQDGEATRRQVAAALRAESYGGIAASQVGEDRFALVRTGKLDKDRITRRLAKATGGRVSPRLAELPLSATTSTQTLRAMRYALDRYLEDGAEAAEKGFMAAVQRTLGEETRFRAALAEHAFHLAYQPVVDLRARSLHHFEALARFEADGSPAATIRMAEELEIITDFDLAVFRKVADMIRSCPPDVRIAANVSGFSLTQPGFVQALLEVCEPDPRLRRRLLIEITETSRLSNLERANGLVGELRAKGHAVCLDDFGAGFASLEYLRHLDVDFVKIDGKYVRSIESRDRDGVLVKSMVALCTELGISTIVEMVETEQAAQIATDLGASLGQGWCFGKPSARPEWTPPQRPALKRTGQLEEWR